MGAGSVKELRSTLGSDTEGNNIQLPKLAESYRYFHEVIEGFVRGLEDGGEDEGDVTALEVASQSDRLYAILHALKTTLQVVVIELEERDDPQVIFETLNARGQPLLPSDLIRNTVFLDASAKGNDIDRLYVNYWRHLMNAECRKETLEERTDSGI